MIGQRIGPYAVLSKLGEGGMGEVYRAHDDVLRRDVAIKVVAERQLGDSDGRARFEREARALAMLNHPNISSIYGFVDSGGIRAIVMELVEGLTLKEIIEGSRPQAPGPSTIENTLSIARQLIDALEAAHDKGIVHRDLKPANIKVTRAGAVKVLDFGIAKALASATGDRSDETTIEATEQGTVVGTAAYMSPEQARGQVVDARADIWAFGAVLYELLTRRKAFPGGTATDVMAALLTKEPDWSAIPADVRPGVVRLLRRCLEKDPARRLRHIADARFEIEDPTMPVASNPAPASRRWRLTAIAAIALLGGAVLGVALRPLFVSGDARGDRPAGAITFGFSEPPGTKFNLFNDPIKVSPDGTRVALAPISPDGKSRLWIRSMSSAVPERLDGTEGATFPFWSPDGKSIGFFADGQVKVIDLSSRAVRAIAPWAPGGLGGGSWNADGVIVFAEVGPGLKRVRATGGDVKPATTLDTTGGEKFHVAPHFLPDNRHYLYTALATPPEKSSIAIGSLDSAETTYLQIPAIAQYAAPGYLVYPRGGELLAQQFNLDRLRLEGDPIVVARNLWMPAATGFAALSVSSTGTLTFAERRIATSQLTWFDRTGRRAGVLGEPGEWVHLALSPDEHTVAAERLESRTGNGTIWIIDADRNLPSRLTQDPGWSLLPLWSKDGRRVLFASGRTGEMRWFARSADGSGTDEALPVPPGLTNATDWMPDGRLVFTSQLPTPTILTMPLTGSSQVAPLIDKDFQGAYGRISPDGRWLAYMSAESGKVDIFVRALSGPGRWAISRNGGLQPRWRRDGKELYFLTADWSLMAVPITTTATTFSAGEPVPLHIRAQADTLGARYVYDVANLGQRFLVNYAADTDQTPTVTVIVNWTSLLRR